MLRQDVMSGVLMQTHEHATTILYLRALVTLLHVQNEF